MRYVALLVALFLLLFAHSLRPQSNTPAGTAGHRTTQTSGNLPLSFEANEGQTDSHVKFLSRGNGYTLFLTSTEMLLAFSDRAESKREEQIPTAANFRNRPTRSAEAKRRPQTVRMKLLDANPRARVEGVQQLPGKNNYFIGNDPKKWRTNVSTYAKVRYTNVYPGVDLVYYSTQRQLEYDFILAPGADPNSIVLAFNGAGLKTDGAGDLVLSTESHEIHLHRPRVYQEINGTQHEVEARYVLRSERAAGFQLAAYDIQSPLIIDPILVYSTYLGGSGTDRSLAPAVDKNGNVYVTGETSSVNFPTTNPLQPALGGGLDVFVTKLNESGSSVVYSTYIGGLGDESALGIALDASGNAYLSGRTASINFPTANALQTAYAGGLSDCFVAKLNETGSMLVYSTYLGGTGQDECFDLRLDTVANAYVSGRTNSTDFPTANAVQPTNAGGFDAFVAKLNAAGSALIYSTYLGGSGNEGGAALALDGDGNAYVAANTSSADFPTINPLQAAYGGGLNDAFVAKLNPSGTQLVYSTYLGGSDNDLAAAVAVDPSGFAYVAGRTSSMDFPTANPLQRTYAGGPSDCFVAKLNAAGSMLVYSTYLGGSGNQIENIFGIAADAAGNAYVSGFTNSLDFPIVNAFQPSYGGGNSDAFTAKLNATGSALVYSSYLGGRDADRGDYIVLDAAGNVYMIGWTASFDFPTRNPFQATFGGGTFDGFVVKLSVDDRPTTIAIVSAASFNTSPVASESIVAAFGVGFVNPAATTVRVKDSSGTERSAPVFFVSQNQINFQIPQGTVPGTATVTVFDYNAAIAVGSIQITP